MAFGSYGMAAESAGLRCGFQRWGLGYAGRVSEPGRERKPRPLFIVSDGTGETAAAVARAALAQFQVEFTLRRFGGIRNEALARRVAAEAEKQGAMVVFTLVDRRVARALLEETQKRG